MPYIPPDGSFLDPGRSSSGVERQDLVVEAVQRVWCGESFARLRRCRGGRGNPNRQFAEFAPERLPALPLRVLPPLFATGSALAVAEVIGHFRFQCLFNQQFGELLEQPVFANQVFRLLVISQQPVQHPWQRLSAIIVRNVVLPGNRLQNSYTLICLGDDHLCPDLFLIAFNCSACVRFDIFGYLS